MVVVAAGEPTPDLVERGEDILVRERSTLVRRGRDEQDRHVALGCGGEIGRRSQPLTRGRDEVLQPRLLDRCAPVVQQLHRLPG